ncbi:MAG: glycosyltransferase [bacterium]|nr:glycosyltransferase [bacterium]
MELSIIIPVYNSEKYISQCLDSIISVEWDEMECIIVNDGSMDNSAKIISLYEQKDSRIRLVSEKNSGVSAARNMGLSYACGRYVMFLDADDFMTSNSWTVLQKWIKDKQYEFMAFSYYTYYNTGETKEELFPLGSTSTDDMSTVREYIMASSRLNMCWGKLFLLDYIKKFKLSFPTDLKIGEDYIFVSEYIRHIKLGLLSNECIVNYRQHGDSAMRRYDMDTRLGYLKKLYEYNKECVLETKDKKLLSNMYIYYLRMITNMSLEYAKFKRKKELQQMYSGMLQQEFVEEILTKIDKSCMPSKMKAMEYHMLKKKEVALLSCYFMIKAKFAR